MSDKERLSYAITLDTAQLEASAKRASNEFKSMGGNIENQGKQFIRISMQKTKQEIIIPLSENALKWLPERHAQNDDECVFSRLGEYTNKGLQLWAAQAGIKKHVSYHVARHTFATMLITFGADLYTVSKLLGHTDIKVTQIYAKLVDAKKVEAVELFNGKFR